jgi:hypothetical protein
MTDEARVQPSPLVALAAMAPDAVFGAARMLQRATFATLGRAARVGGAVAGAVLDTPPIRASLVRLEPPVAAVAARGVVLRQGDEEQLKAFLVSIEPLVSTVLQFVVDLLPIEAILDRVDVDSIVRRVDVDALVQRVDVDGIIQRVDVPTLVTEVLENVELGDIIADSSTNIASSARDSARVQAIRADGGLAGVIDRLLRRGRGRDLVVRGYPQVEPA